MPFPIFIEVFLMILGCLLLPSNGRHIGFSSQGLVFPVCIVELINLYCITQVHVFLIYPYNYQRVNFWYL